MFILAQHTRYFFRERVGGHGCYLAVEFFFVLSGWFLARSVFRDNRPFSLDEIGEQTIGFLSRRLQGFALPYCIGFALSFAVALISGGIRSRISNGLVFEFLLLGETGLAPGSSRQLIMGSGWYLSALMISIFLIYPVFRFNKRFFATWIAPLCAVFALGFLVREFGAPPSAVGTRFGLFSANFIRGFGEICCGIAAFRASIWLETISFSQRRRQLLRIFGTMLPLLAFGWIATGLASRSSTTILLLFSIFTALGGSGLSFSSRFPKGVCQWLGRLSLWLYMTHWAVAKGLELLASRNLVFGRLAAARDTHSIAASFALYFSLCFALALGCMAVFRQRGRT